MSFITEALITPSRVISVVRYLLFTKNTAISQDELEMALSPKHWIGDADLGGDTAHAVISEMLAVGLLIGSKEELSLRQDLNGPTEKVLRTVLRNTIVQLSGDETSSNYDFARLVAWYLSQNPYDAPGSWEDFEKVLDEQVGSGRLNCTNNTRYGQFEDWCIYCGFGWKYAIDGGKLVPDATLYLSSVLPTVFAGQKAYKIKEFLTRLNHIAPLFETGSIRGALTATGSIPLVEDNHLSSSTSLSLLRLEEQGVIELHSRSDGQGFVLHSGGSRDAFNVTDIVWKGRVKK